MADIPKRRPRRQFIDEFKASAVRLGAAPRAAFPSPAAPAGTRRHRHTTGPTGSEPPVTRFEPGDQCGAYRLVRLLARGATGEVYEAEDTSQTRRLALTIFCRRLRRGRGPRTVPARGPHGCGRESPWPRLRFESGLARHLIYKALQYILTDVWPHTQRHGHSPCRWLA
jgi:hypothetical protein